jgi:hypothetical protein
LIAIPSPSPQFPCIIITAKGQPDVATRWVLMLLLLLVHALACAACSWLAAHGYMQRSLAAPGPAALTINLAAHVLLLLSTL